MTISVTKFDGKEKFYGTKIYYFNMYPLRGCCQIISKPKTKSIYWAYFGLPADDNGSIVNKNVVICKLCTKSIAYGGGTSNLASHLKVHHPKEFKSLCLSSKQQQMPQRSIENEEVYNSNQELANIKIESVGVDDVEFLTTVDIDDDPESSDHLSEKDSEVESRLKNLLSSVEKESEARPKNQRSAQDSDQRENEVELRLSKRLCIQDSVEKEREVEARLKKRKSAQDSDDRESEIEARLKKRKCVQDFDDTSFLYQERRKPEKVSKQSEEESPIDMFFKCMAASVKTLSLERQIRAKILVSQVIGNLELEEISSKYLSIDSSKPSSSFVSNTDPASVINDPFKK